MFHFQDGRYVRTWAPARVYCPDVNVPVPSAPSEVSLFGAMLSVSIVFVER